MDTPWYPSYEIRPKQLESLCVRISDAHQATAVLAHRVGNKSLGAPRQNESFGYGNRDRSL